MKVEIYEADPFTQRKDKLLTTLNTDYRFQRGTRSSSKRAAGR